MTHVRRVAAPGRAPCRPRPRRTKKEIGSPVAPIIQLAGGRRFATLIKQIAGNFTEYILFFGVCWAAPTGPWWDAHTSTLSATCLRLAALICRTKGRVKQPGKTTIDNIFMLNIMIIITPKR